MMRFALLSALAFTAISAGLESYAEARPLIQCYTSSRGRSYVNSSRDRRTAQQRTIATCVAGGGDHRECARRLRCD